MAMRQTGAGARIRLTRAASQQGPGFSPEEVAADARRVGRALARLSRLLEQTAQSSGLSSSQYRVLLFVARRPSRASELATRMDIRRPTLSSIVNGLERLGLVRRYRAQEDGRGVRLDLTDAGRAALEQVECDLEERLGGLITSAEVDARRLSGDLERLSAILGA